jgi:antitoxin component YwqK of YwqJK toxin-antitoxin module
MKSTTLLIALIIGFLTTAVSAQETIWFDSNWTPTGKEKAIYYRPTPKSQKKGFLIIDYYMSGTRKREGFSLNTATNKEKYDGVVRYYFADEALSQEIKFSNGKMEGDRKIYFKSGNLKSEEIYENDKKEGKFFEYYETGAFFKQGVYEDNLKEEIWKTFYKNGKIKERGKYEKGEKIGVWKSFYKNVYKK